MPYPHRIARQEVAIVMDSPVRRDLAASLAAAAAADASLLADVGGISMDVGGGGSQPRRMLLQCGMNAAAASFETPESDLPQEYYIQEEPRDYADMYEQWDALADRERRDAYRLAPYVLDDEPGRQKICTWAYGVIDKLDLDRPIVALAMSYFDRLASANRLDGKPTHYALVCLHVAVKAGWGRPMNPSDLSWLSRGYFDAGRLARLECRVLQDLGWYVNPPLANDFLELLRPILEVEPMSEHDFDEYGHIIIDKEVRHQVVEQARFLCEKAVMDSFFSSVKPSSTARAAIIVAMDLMRFPSDAVDFVASLPIDYDREETDVCVQVLHQGCGPEDIVGGDYWSGCAAPDTAPDTDAPIKETVVRTVTPTKDDRPSPTKRTFQESAVDTLWKEEDDDDGDDGIVPVDASPRKIRRMHKRAKIA